MIRGRERPATLHADRAGRAGVDGGFAAALQRRYRQRLAGETLMSNELYLAVVFRPAATMATGLLSRLARRTQPAVAAVELADALDACEKLAQTGLASLARYDPEALGIYTAGARRCSALLEYLGVLINGERQAIALPQGPLSKALA